MKNLKQYFMLVLVHILLVLFGVRVAGAQCMVSPECTTDPMFNLFPIPGSYIFDNSPDDLDPTCGVISVTGVPIPGSAFARFSGDIVFQQPQGSQPGELIVTNATIDNPEGNPPLMLAGLHLACGEFSWVTPPAPGILGFLRTEIDGELRTKEKLTSGNEVLVFHAIGESMTIPGNPPTPPQQPAYVTAFWVAVGPEEPPVPMNGVAQKEGRFASGVGIIDFQMNVTLPAGETMLLPNSVKVTFGPEAPAEPPRSRWGLLLLGLGLLVAIAVFLLLRRRRGSEGRSAGS